MPKILWDPARQVWYSPDLSKGIVRELVEDGGDWPVSGDAIAHVRADSQRRGLIAIIDWEALENEIATE